jgi:putative sterol carrier protein
MEKANADEEFSSRARDFTASFAYKVTNKLEELPPVYMRFEKGRVTEVHVLTPDDKTDYRLESEYEIWTQISKGELDGATAIMTRQMRFFGSMGDIMRYAKAFQRLLTLMTMVEVEY